MSVSDKVQVIEGTPPALPGNCFTCSSADRKRFVDWGISIEFHGAFYMCDACLLEAADKLGCLSESASKDLLREQVRDKLKIEKLEGELASVKEILRGYKSLSSYLGDEPNPVPVSSDTPRPSKKRDREERGEVESGETGSPEQSDEPGLGDVRPTELVSKPGKSI